MESAISTNSCFAVERLRIGCKSRNESFRLRGSANPELEHWLPERRRLSVRRQWGRAELIKQK